MRDFASLAGRQIANANMVEMAFFDEGCEGLPVFTHPNIPFIQAYLLELKFENGETVQICTHQNDDTWGLCLKRQETPQIDLGVKADPKSIYRNVEFTGFPKGKINHIEVLADDKGDATQIELCISQSTILIKAGEVYEDWESAFYICAQDESLLIFLDLELLKTLEFR